MNSKKILTLGLAALFAGLVSTASAAFVLIDDFDRADSATVGNGWVADTQYSIVDNSLRAQGNNGEAYKLLDPGSQIANNTTGTFFFQIFVAGTPVVDESLSFGLSDLATPGGSTGDFEVQVSIADPGSTAVAGTTLFPNDGTNQTLAADTWYNVWAVADNTNDEVDWYLTTGTSAAVAAFSTDSGFRNGTTDALQSVFSRTFGSNPANSDVRFDNLYIDPTGQNLANPVVIPEPSTFALMAGVLGLGLVMLRRRR